MIAVRIKQARHDSDAPIDPLDHAAAAIFSIVRPASMTAISSSSCLIDKLESSAPCADLSSVIKRWRWTFISSNTFRFLSLTYVPTIRSIASDMCENSFKNKTPPNSFLFRAGRRKAISPRFVLMLEFCTAFPQVTRNGAGGVNTRRNRDSCAAIGYRLCLFRSLRFEPLLERVSAGHAELFFSARAFGKLRGEKEVPGIFHVAADILSAGPVAALWDWTLAIGPPGKAWRPTARYRSPAAGERPKKTQYCPLLPLYIPTPPPIPLDLPHHRQARSPAHAPIQPKPCRRAWDRGRLGVAPRRTKYPCFPTRCPSRRTLPPTRM
jgi:hypothetical protein